MQNKEGEEAKRPNDCWAVREDVGREDVGREDVGREDVGREDTPMS
jgi:hypothetical protein